MRLAINNQVKTTKGKLGGWRPGSGRKKGSLNKTKAEVMLRAQLHTADAINALAHIMLNGESEAARVAAADKLLDRGHGKAPQPQTGEDGTGPIAIVFSWQPHSG